MIIVITGPTCSGKSEDAYNLALLLNAEIINCDAFQIYKEMDIGVAKPKHIHENKIVHHLFDFITPDTNYSIKQFQDDFRKIVDNLLSKNKNIIVVGGSGLYLKSALYDYKFNEEIDLSPSLEKYNNLKDLELYEQLKKIDPEDAKKIHPNNRKRIIRSLQIFYSTGKTKSEIISLQQHNIIYNDVYIFVKNIDRDFLYSKINSRVDEMMKDGLLQEVTTLYKKFGSKCQCMQAIGYKEFIPYFEKNISVDECVDNIKKHTRNYAKRQYTFVNNQFNVLYYNDIQDILKVNKNG